LAERKVQPRTLPLSVCHVDADADPEDRNAVYSELNLTVIYHDDGRMQVSAGPDACTNKCVGGASATLNPRRTRSDWMDLMAA